MNAVKDSMDHHTCIVLRQADCALFIHLGTSPPTVLLTHLSETATRTQDMSLCRGKRMPEILGADLATRDKWIESALVRDSFCDN